jgi:hypothetical protein
MIRRAAQDANVPFLNIVQACSWTPARRVPNGDEMRYLLYSTLAYGAQGISYYVNEPSHVVVVNLDYKTQSLLALVGPGSLETFDAASGTWSSTGNQRAELPLAPGGGRLVRMAP